MPTGHVINYMVRNDLLMCEIEFPNGRTFVGDIGVGKVDVKKLPYELHEMEIEIDPKCIFKEDTITRRDGNRLVTKYGKWGMIVKLLYSPDGKLLSYNGEFTHIKIPEPFRKLIVTPKSKNN